MLGSRAGLIHGEQTQKSPWRAFQGDLRLLRFTAFAVPQRRPPATEDERTFNLSLNMRSADLTARRIREADHQGTDRARTGVGLRAIARSGGVSAAHPPFRFGEDARPATSSPKSPQRRKLRHWQNHLARADGEIESAPLITAYLVRSAAIRSGDPAKMLWQKMIVAGT